MLHRWCERSFPLPVCAISDSHSITPFTISMTAGTQTDLWQSPEGPSLVLCLPADLVLAGRNPIVEESQSISSPVRQLYHYLPCIYLTMVSGISICLA